MFAGKFFTQNCTKRRTGRKEERRNEARKEEEEDLVSWWVFVRKYMPLSPQKNDLRQILDRNVQPLARHGGRLV